MTDRLFLRGKLGVKANRIQINAGHQSDGSFRPRGLRRERGRRELGRQNLDRRGNMRIAASLLKLFKLQDV